MGERIFAFERLDGLARRVFHLLATPDTLPEAPSGPGEVIAIERPSRQWLRYQLLWFAIGATAIGLTLLVALVAIAVGQPLALIIALPVALVVAAIGVVHWFAIHLRYHTTAYVITDRAVRLRNGIWIVTEMTLTYANVQNVTVVQGPIERLFGFANVVVDTAGGGGVSAEHAPLISAHQGRLLGLEDASRIRDLIQAQLKRHGARSTGLGDRDDGAVSVRAARAEVLGEIREAAARLRTAATALGER